MKIALCHPGAEWSVSDVHRGLRAAFEKQKIEIIDYAMAGRITASGEFLKSVGKRRRKENPRAKVPGPMDYLYHASTGMLERALRHEVDWVFIISGMWFHPDVLLFLRRAGIKTAVLLTESPYDDHHESIIASLVDVVFTNERSSVKTFEPKCHEVHYYQHAYDPEVHEPSDMIDESVPSYDVVFVGTGFIERCNMLSGVNWDGINFGLYGSWGMLGSRSKVRKHLRGEVVPNETATQLYRQAKIGINVHRTSIGYGREVPHVQGAESMNPRCYELAATKTFYISDNRAELGEVFGDVVPTFETPRQLEGLIRRYLKEDGQRRAIAERLPGLVRGHTFDDRVEEILQVLARFTRR